MILAAAIFVILGILIKYGKMYFLIAGYNTMPKAEKARYDIAGIATLFRNVMFGMAAIIISGYFMAKWLSVPRLDLYFFFVAMLLGVTYLLVQANSKKYRKSEK